MNRKELEQCAWDATPEDERRDRVEHRVGAKYRDHKRISEPRQRIRKLTGNNREIRVFDPSGSTPGSMSPWMPLWALYNDELMQRCEQGIEPKLRKPYSRTRRDYKSSIESGSSPSTKHATKKASVNAIRVGDEVRYLGGYGDRYVVLAINGPRATISSVHGKGHTETADVLDLWK